MINKQILLDLLNQKVKIGTPLYLSNGYITDKPTNQPIGYVVNIDIMSDLTEHKIQITIK